jgi:site-specific DNA-methyltransferase (adenine-specific)
VTPYYADDLVTIYHGDAREAMAENWWPWDGVIVTDPPYGITWRRGENRVRLSPAHGGIAGDHDTSLRDDVLGRWAPRGAIVFGSLYAPFPGGIRQVLVWQKPGDAGVVGSTMGYRRDVEAVFLIGELPNRPASRSSVLRSVIANVGNPSSPAGKTGHPHAKPVDLLMDLIAWTDWTVLDPFVGSGSTLVAAKAMGRRAIGIEIEERYCEVAAQRCSQEVLGLLA